MYWYGYSRVKVQRLALRTSQRCIMEGFCLLKDQMFIWSIWKDDEIDIRREFDVWSAVSSEVMINTNTICVVTWSKGLQAWRLRYICGTQVHYSGKCAGFIYVEKEENYVIANEISLNVLYANSIYEAFLFLCCHRIKNVKKKQFFLRIARLNTQYSDFSVWIIVKSKFI